MRTFKTIISVSSSEVLGNDFRISTGSETVSDVGAKERELSLGLNFALDRNLHSWAAVFSSKQWEFIQQIVIDHTLLCAMQSFYFDFTCLDFLFLCVCLCTVCVLGALRGGRRALNPLELQLQTLASWAISLAPDSVLGIRE